MSWAAVDPFEPLSCAADERLRVLLGVGVDANANASELLNSGLGRPSGDQSDGPRPATLDDKDAKCQSQRTAAASATPAMQPAVVNDDQRRSRHNANERRRTSALKTRILQMREEMEALERQRTRLQSETGIVTPTHNRAFLDTVALIDQLREQKLVLRKKLQQYDMQNNTYQTIVSEFGAQSEGSSPSGNPDSTLYDVKGAEDASGDEKMLLSAPIFQRVLFRRPMSMEAAMACVKESYEAIMAFRAEHDFESLNREVLGWCDKRILNNSSLRFMLSQHFEYVPAPELVYKTWNLLTDLKLYRHMQPRTTALEILQRVTEDCVIVRLSVSGNGDQVHHSILLIARGRINGGFLITYRSIPLSEGQRQFATTESNYVHLFNWYMFQEKYTSAGIPACEVTFGGSVQNQSAEYLRYLMMEVVAGVVRWQTAVGHSKFRLTNN